MLIWTLHSQSLRIWNGIRATFWGLTRHSYFSASTLFNHKLGLTNQHAGGNCIFWIARNSADSLVKAIALVRFRKVENLETQIKNGYEKIYFHYKNIAFERSSFIVFLHRSAWRGPFYQLCFKTSIKTLNVNRNLYPSVVKQNSSNWLLTSKTLMKL